MYPDKRWIWQILLIAIFVAPVPARNRRNSNNTPDPSSRIEQRFSQLKKSPPELHAFLLRMPKGGDLHNHLAGAVYAETYINAAAEAGLCIDQRTYTLEAARTEGGCAAPYEVPAVRAESDNDLFNTLVDNFSMRDFVPGSQSGHDHFFATFAKFGAAAPPQPGSFVAEVVRRAAEQNESYLELMAISGGSVEPIGNEIGFNGNFAQTANRLSTRLPAAVSALKAHLDAIQASLPGLLGCKEHPAADACHVTVRYQYQVLREASKSEVFAEVLAGFMLAAEDPRVVAINFVQPEDGLNAMRDYQLHMQMVQFVKHLYPNVHVSLHAGEVAMGLVPPEGLRFHIREAVETGQAERIGHGVDVMYEKDAFGLLASMRQKRIAVEINLTSNDEILGVKGEDHPFPVYRRYGVPVVLSTDDEGVGRTDLTHEYERAVLTYGLTYADVKEIARNSIEYSFLPGTSLWSDGTYRNLVKACSAGIDAKSCAAFLAGNEKARAQADLEARFRAFELLAFVNPKPSKAAGKSVAGQ